MYKANSNNSESIINGVSNKELQMLCQGEWLNDNVSTENNSVVAS